MHSGRFPGHGLPPEPGRPRTGNGRSRLWRLSRSPLRRREDVAEAWLILVVWIVVAVGGVLAGAVAGHAGDAALQRQRAESRTVTAVLTEDAPWDSAVSGQAGEHVRATVRWTGPDGARHTANTLVDPGRRAGEHVTVWENRSGELTHHPPGRTEAWLQSALLGGAATVAFSGLTYAAGRGLRAGLDWRRAALWEKEWKAVEPRWHHMR